MWSPPQEKGTRRVPPWAKDYHTTVAEMKTQLLLTSTLTGDNRLGQDLVERFVLVHTHLKLEQRLDLYEDGH